jgi:hypothetical protein
MMVDGPQRAEEYRDDEAYFRAGEEREPQRPVEEQRFSATHRNLTRSRFLIASTLDELVKANGYLASIRQAAWLAVWLLIATIVVQLWR